MTRDCHFRSLSTCYERGSTPSAVTGSALNEGLLPPARRGCSPWGMLSHGPWSWAACSSGGGQKAPGPAPSTSALGRMGHPGPGASDVRVRRYCRERSTCARRGPRREHAGRFRSSWERQQSSSRETCLGATVSLVDECDICGRSALWVLPSRTPTSVAFFPSHTRKLRVLKAPLGAHSGAPDPNPGGAKACPSPGLGPHWACCGEGAA